MNRYNFKNHIKGDTLKEIVFTMTLNEEPMDLTDVIIQSQFRKHPNSKDAVLFLTSVDNEGITITENPGEFKINQQIIDIPAGDYVYDIEFTFDDGTVKTYIYGDFKVIQDITRIEEE